MNAFQLVRPRGADIPSPVKKHSKPAKVRGVTRVLNAAGQWQSRLEPSHHSIVIEGQAKGRESADKRSRIVWSLSQ